MNACSLTLRPESGRYNLPELEFREEPIAGRAHPSSPHPGRGRVEMPSPFLPAGME